jgi:hypothetical protein
VLAAVPRATRDKSPPAVRSDEAGPSQLTTADEQTSSNSVQSPDDGRTTCPQCTTRVKRLGLHLRQRHKLETGSVRYFKLMADSKLFKPELSQCNLQHLMDSFQEHLISIGGFAGSKTSINSPTDSSLVCWQLTMQQLSVFTSAVCCTSCASSESAVSS